MTRTGDELDPVHYSAGKDEAANGLGMLVSTHGGGRSGTERLSNAPQVAQLVDDELEIQRKFRMTNAEVVCQRSHFSNRSKNCLTAPVTPTLQ